MKNLILLIGLISLFTQQTNACINTYYSLDKEGHFHIEDDIHRGFNKNFNIKLIAGKLPKLEEELKTTNYYKKLSDYAVLLLKIGKKEEALALFIELYAHHPDEYQIAANLGTAYEINGEVDSAIFYIKKGMELNPNAHEGSEWVHLRVLQTKKELKKDSLYLEKTTVLQLSSADKMSDTIRKQLVLQVRERFPFTPAPDRIMGNLLFDLAECYSNTASIEYAKALYTISSEYYGNQNPEVREKIEEMITLREAYKEKQPEDDHTEGMVIKTSGIPYRTIIDDNDYHHYQPDWTLINTNVSDLCEMVDWKLLNSVEYEIADEPKKENSVETNKPFQRPKRDMAIYILFAFSFFVVCILYLRKNISRPKHNF